MAELLFSQEADATLTRLEADPAQQLLVGRLHAALDLLEADPGLALCRRRRFALIDLWGKAVAVGDEDWLILWEPGHQSDTVVVHTIAPAPRRVSLHICTDWVP